MRLVLGPIVGHTTHHTTRIWLQSDRAADDLQCEVYTDSALQQPVPASPYTFSTSAAAGYTGVAEITHLPAVASPYFYRFTHQGQPLHPDSYRFCTLAQNPQKFTFAVSSCHLPLKYSGTDQTLLWRRMRAVLDTKGVNMMLQIGDQIYSDGIKPLFGKSNTYWDRAVAAHEAGGGGMAAAVAEFRACYRQFWDYADLAAVTAHYPQYMIWDDHDIANGWGSNSENQAPAQQAAFAAARQAYIEYQHSHNPVTAPGVFYYGFDVGPAAFLVMDLRGERQAWNNRLLGDAQYAWIDQFLAARPETTTLFLFSSVPLFHLAPLWAMLPSFLKRGISDVTDQWSSPPNRGDRIRLLNRLHRWISEQPQRRIVLLGGDVHIGTFGKAIYTGGQIPCQLIQATTSPISNKPAGLLDRLVRRVSGRFKLDLGGGLGLDVDLPHRFTRRNFLLVHLEYPTDSTVPALTFEFYTDNGTTPERFTL